jgi:hypothetical protein
MTDIRRLQENFERWTKDEPLLNEDSYQDADKKLMVVELKKALESVKKVFNVASKPQNNARGLAEAMSKVQSDLTFWYKNSAAVAKKDGINI